MAAVDPADLPEEDPIDRARRVVQVQKMIARIEPWCRLFGLPWIAPLWRMMLGEAPGPHLREIWRGLVVPVLSIAGFLLLWGWLAPQVQTSLGAIPGPAQVWEQVGVLHTEAQAEADRETAFYERQSAKNAELVAAGKANEVKTRPYAGKPTYVDQILTSLRTVFMGFALASVVAMPLSGWPASLGRAGSTYRRLRFSCWLPQRVVLLLSCGN